MENRFFFNGIHQSTGQYLFSPTSPETLNWLISRASGVRFTEKAPGYPVVPGNLEQTGWGVIFARDTEPAVREHLSVLLEYRRLQTKAAQGLYRELSGRSGYQPGESKIDMLARVAAGPGPVDPKRLPYYLLLVGSPEEIPWEIQYQLDIQHAVGRIYFDTLEGYSRYAQAVVAYETGQSLIRPQATFFATRHAGDPVTTSAADLLVAPLIELCHRQLPTWHVDSLLGVEASKQQLAAHLGGSSTPDFLFTSTHGLGFDIDHPDQRSRQGSLICQDWPGPGQPVLQNHCFAASDLTEQIPRQGLISFHLACYSAGMPREDNFSVAADGSLMPIARHSFIGALPMRLLAAGALAVIGHVERAWTWSFLWEKQNPNLEAFRSTVLAILDGNPVGFALEAFNSRYAELASDLDVEIQRVARKVPSSRLALLWTARNDARNYVLLGDPAVRLAVDRAQGSIPTQL